MVRTGQETVLEVRGLTRRFGAVVALDSIDLTVPRGAFFALVGPNGAGKTTTVRILSGLLRGQAGEVRLLGVDPSRDPFRVRELVGVVPDFLPLWEPLTARENLLEIAALRGLPREETVHRIADLAEALGLADALDQPVLQLSHGTRKKVTLAAAMLHAPPLLFLDEPFEGIDPVAARTIRHLLAALRERGVTLLLTSHVLPLVETLATHLAILDHGRIAAAGPLEEVLAGRTLEEAFAAAVGEPAPAPDLSWYRPGGGR